VDREALAVRAVPEVRGLGGRVVRLREDLVVPVVPVVPVVLDREALEVREVRLREGLVVRMVLALEARDPVCQVALVRVLPYRRRASRFRLTPVMRALRGFSGR